MDRNTIIFIALLAILFIGQFLIEGFTEEPKLLSTELERIQTYIYHPDNYYDITNALGIFSTNSPLIRGKTVTIEVIYNGKGWKFTRGLPFDEQGRRLDASGNINDDIPKPSPLLGSTVGAPSDTNTNWKQVIIPIPFTGTLKIAEIFLENTIIGSVPLSPADMISKYIQSLIYSPNKTYTKNTHDAVAIYHGNMWVIQSTILGSTAGTPSTTNSNWKLLSFEEIPYKDIIDAIKNTAIAGLPAPASPPARASILQPDIIDEIIERIQRIMYNENKYYDAYSGLSSAAVYNGNYWIFTNGYTDNEISTLVYESNKAGERLPKILGSTAGIPSNTNSNWKILDISMADDLHRIIIQNTKIGLSPLSRADIISKYINDLMYDPNKYYKRLSNNYQISCIYNGKVWITTINNNDKIIGSTLGPPSTTNPNWKLITIEGKSEYPKDLVTAIENTAIAAQAPAPPKEPAPAPNPLGYTTVSLSDLLLFNARKAPNTDYSSSIQKSPLPVINARGSPLDARVESFAAQQGIDFMRHISKRTPTNLF